MNPTFKFHSTSGQSTIEYVVFVTAILVVAVTVVMGRVTYDNQHNIKTISYSAYQEKLNQTYSAGADSVHGATQRAFVGMANSPAVKSQP